MVLCTPHTLHCGQIVLSANAKKHVFCEKPLALSRADALRAVAACNANNVVLGVGHERRFEPPVLELFRLVKSGELGTPLQIEANFSQDKFLSLPADNWRISSEEAPAGPMTATGIHLLDLSVGLLGPADRAFASVRQLDSQLANGDTLAALVTFKSGANALISAILATPFIGRFAVFGSKGQAEVRQRPGRGGAGGLTFTGCPARWPAGDRGVPGRTGGAGQPRSVRRRRCGRGRYPVPQEQMIANVSALEAVFRSAVSGKVEKVED